MEDREIVARAETSPIDYAGQFLKDGGDLAHLEKMMELQERYEANQAKKAYQVAMSEFKKDPPKITKSKSVDYATKSGNRTQYKHAELAAVAECINTELSKHGLSSSWKTSQDAGGISVSCTITHVLGHAESTVLSSPPDISGGKNSIQAIGSTITYLQRYTLLALTGLAAHDQDDDGKGSENTGLHDVVKDEISKLVTIEELTKYYKQATGKDGYPEKELVISLAARKEEIVKGAMNADS